MEEQNNRKEILYNGLIEYNKDKYIFSCETRTEITLNLEQNPASGGIPAVENSKIEKVKAKTIFHFFKKDQLIKYLSKIPLLEKFIKKEKIPKFIII